MNKDVDKVQCSQSQCLQPGTGLGGDRYHIQRLLERTAFDATYAAWDEDLYDYVLLKEFLPIAPGMCLRQQGNNEVIPASSRILFEEAKVRFREEAWRWGTEFAYLHTLCLIRQFSENNTEYLVMSPIEEQPLETWVAENQPTREERLELFQKILEGMAHIHRTGLAHRNLNPRSIRVTRYGEPLLVDVGLGHGGVVGKAHRLACANAYTALEQHALCSAKDPRVDIYGLGAILYFLIRGESPPPASQRLKGTPLNWPRDIPKHWREAGEQALALDAERRTREVAVFSHQLIDGPRVPPLALPGNDAAPWICPITGQVFSNIPEGAFEMGDVWGDGKPTELPVHPVTISAFQLARTVVTQAAWTAVMGANPVEGLGTDLVGENKPVVNVSWEEASAFVRRLNLLVPHGHYRLPSEAEWAYAASGGGCQKWAGTNDEKELPECAWYWENSEYKIHPVAQKRANHFGLYDMSGNVNELCEDDWHDDYHGAPEDGKAWAALDGHIGRVCRGGSCLSKPDWLRCAARTAIRHRGVVSITMGFRLARDAACTHTYWPFDRFNYAEQRLR